jgi:hypothetical protein
MKNIKRKIKEAGKACIICAAKFEVWLDNARLNEERKEKISQHLLSYCPVCSRADGK